MQMYKAQLSNSKNKPWQQRKQNKALAKKEPEEKVKQRPKRKPEVKMSDRLGARIIKEINLKKKGPFLVFEK